MVPWFFFNFPFLLETDKIRKFKRIKFENDLKR